MYDHDMIAKLEELKGLPLNDWDPIGVVGIPEARDEYDSYAFQLHGMLAAGNAAEEVVEYLNWVVTSRIEPMIIALPVEMSDLAATLVFKAFQIPAQAAAPAHAYDDCRFYVTQGAGAAAIH